MSTIDNKENGLVPPYDSLERFGGLAPIVGVPIPEDGGETFPDIDPWPDFAFQDGEHPLEERWDIWHPEPDNSDSRAVRRVNRSAYDSPPVTKQPLTREQIEAKKRETEQRIRDLMVPPEADLATKDKATIEIARAKIRGRIAENTKRGY